MHREVAYYNPQTREIVHTGVPVDADSDDDRYVSLWEAWDYAWNHDQARLLGWETPWYDDDGDGLPTFENGSDHLDQDQGNLASQICFEPSLVTILNTLGFTNIAESTIETFMPATSTCNVTLYGEFGDFHAQNELSWYLAGTSNYHTIFYGPDGNKGYTNPPISRTFTVSDEFGLSFLTPEGKRYFTETSRNPDGLQHTKVYVNLDKPHMYLIGFENLYGVGDKDYDDMIFSIEKINLPPNTPSTPSGNTTGYVYTSYSYSTNTTDPEADLIRYEFCWGDNTNNTITNWNPSGTAINAYHYYARPGTYNLSVRTQDVHYALSGWSDNLTISVSQNDAGTGGDAGNSFSNATYLSWGSTGLSGTLYQSNPNDPEDWYRFYVYVGQDFYVSVTPPPGVNFDLTLYNPAGSPKASSTKGAGYMDEIYYTADSSGNWSMKIYISSGEGHYSFFFGSGPPGHESCPMLFVWNETGYVNYGIIDIHNPSGEDIVKEVPINVEDVSINNYQATFRLREGWEGLNFSESVIDQVKLYAVDNYGNRFLCPLISATHCTLGNVWLKLLFSDEWKTHLLLLETIDLSFLMPYPNVQSYVFVIEGCNQLKQ